MAIEIFSNIDMPKRTVHRGASAKYPTENLQVGQVFFMESRDGEDLEKTRKRVQAATARVRALYPERRFSARLTDHPLTGQQVVGLWRIEDKAPKAPQAEAATEQAAA